MKKLTNYTFTVTPKGSKFLYEVKNEKGEIIASRTSNRGNYIAVMICQDKNNVYVPSFFFSRLDLIGKGDSRHYTNEMIGYASL